ncbi:unnamed protein product, partial [Nesidiocoris tenuis]
MVISQPHSSRFASELVVRVDPFTGNLFVLLGGERQNTEGIHVKKETEGVTYVRKPRE